MTIYRQIIILYQTLLRSVVDYYKKIISRIRKVEARYYFNSRQKLISVVLLVIISGIFLFATPAAAGIMGLMISIIGWVCYLLIMVFGWILTILISILIAVAQYNDFMYAQPVVTGWILVRNIANMFFVIILLVIAFATVLGVQSYNYKSLLKKLIIMALLINFSKTITAFIIDFSQIVMLTFVNAFKDAGYNFTKILGLDEILQLSFKQNVSGGETEKKISEFNVLAALVLGLILVIISSIIVLIFVLILIVRVVYLWLLIVLSPIAYFLSSVPGGQKYASLWWDKFTQQLIIGPLLAFFLWLSLATAQGGAGKISLGGVAVNPEEGYYQQAGSGSIIEEELPPTSPIPSQAAQPANLLSFMIAITLMIVGLILAQEVGGAGGAIAAKGWAKMRAVGTGKLGPTPMRWARERIDALQAKRAEARKERATRFGEGMYARLETAKGKLKAKRVALTGMALERLRGEPVKAQRDIAEAFEKLQKEPTKAHVIGDYEYQRNPDGSISAKNVKTGKAAGTWEEFVARSQYERNEKKKAKRNIMDAINQMEETGERVVEMAGQKFERKDDGSIVVTKDGKQIMSKSQAGVEYMQRYKQHYGPAQQIMDEIVKKKIDQRKDSLAALTPVELRRILTDTASSKNDKLAASMMMLDKEGFKNREELQSAKQNVSSIPSLRKEFDEVADKRFGLWNNSARDFQKKVENGTIDITKLDTRQLNDKSIKLIADITGVNFKSTLSKLNKTKTDQQNIRQALEKRFTSGPGAFNDEDMRYRTAHASVTGDVITAMGGPKRFNQAAMERIIKGAKAEDIAKIDEDLFDVDKVQAKYKILPYEAKSLVDKLSRAIGKVITLNQLKSVNRSGKASNKLMENLINSAHAHSTTISSADLDKEFS